LKAENYSYRASSWPHRYWTFVIVTRGTKRQKKAVSRVNLTLHQARGRKTEPEPNFLSCLFLGIWSKRGNELVER